MEKLEKERLEVEYVIKAVILPYKGGLPLARLTSDYRDVTASTVPYRKFGFPYLADFIRSIPNVHMSNDPIPRVTIQDMKPADLPKMLASQNSTLLTKPIMLSGTLGKEHGRQWEGRNFAFVFPPNKPLPSAYAASGGLPVTKSSCSSAAYGYGIPPLIPRPIVRYDFSLNKLSVDAKKPPPTSGETSYGNPPLIPGVTSRSSTSTTTQNYSTQSNRNLNVPGYSTQNKKQDADNIPRKSTTSVQTSDTRLKEQQFPGRAKKNVKEGEKLGCKSVSLEEKHSNQKTNLSGSVRDNLLKRSSANDRIVKFQKQLDAVHQANSLQSQVQGAAALPADVKNLEPVDDLWEREAVQMIVKPKYCDFQMIGDNMFLEFASKKLKTRCNEIKGQVFRCGMCVSGLTLGDCYHQIKTENIVVHSKVVILLGAVDILMGKSFQEMQKDMILLVKFLYEERFVHKVALCTIPPLLGSTAEQKENQLQFNTWILQIKLSIHAGFEEIKCIDLFEMFIGSNKYEQYYKPQTVGVDLGGSIINILLWNEKGYDQVHRVLEHYLFL